MATLTTNLLSLHQNNNNSHPKHQFIHSLTLSTSLHFQVDRFFSFPPRYAVSHAIRSPNFDFNLPKFDDDDDDNVSGNSQRSRRRSDRRRWKKRRGRSDESSEVEVGIFGQVVDSLWILKVLKSYGWFSPIILLTLLIATGPKAFLMAFSLPFGLSLVILAFQKLQEWLVGGPKPQNRRKRRSKFGRRMDAIMEEEDDQDEIQQVKRNKKRENQSWVFQTNGSFNKSDSGSRVNVNSFGGWDDLIGEEETQRTRRPSRETDRLETMLKKERLSRSMKERDLPMLLRLLIAVFPFLASWTSFL